DVLQSAAGSSDFFARAAQAAVDLLGLDSGRILLWGDGRWQTQAVRTAAALTAEQHWQPSREILDRVRREKRAFWQERGGATVGTVRLRAVRAVVAAPILDRSGEVIAVLYGDCWRGRDGPAEGEPRRITRLEAALAELLAGVVAAGLARVEQERAALAAR